MRKLLLATSALLGASVGIANAGTLTPNAPNPPPGTITVTFNALVEVFGFAGSDSGGRDLANPGGVYPAGSAHAGQPLPGAKVSPFAIGSYSRLYPSFDGSLANGIKYGGSIEIRHVDSTTAPATNGTSGATGAGSQTATLYNQREYVYIGTDKLGKVYLGSQVPATELFQVGNEVGFNDGGWDGDLPGFFVTGLPYFIDDANDQANKVVYVSPQFAGVDFGVGFEPNGIGRSFNPTTRISSVPSDVGAFGIRRNTIDGAIRYQGTFSDVGVKAQLGGSYGGSVLATDGYLGARSNQNYSLFAAGLAATFGGFEVGAHLDTGRFGGGLGTLNTGDGSTTAWIAGGTYTIGPVVVGANYYGFNSGQHSGLSVEGSGVGVGMMNGFGIAAGGTYTLAPGASVFLSYLYGQNKQNGYDLVNGGASDLNNHVTSQGIGVGTAFKW
jgi:hypothetical protein